MNTPLANPVKRFFSDYLPVQKGLAANTIAAYRDALKLLLCYGADTRKKAVKELTVEDLDEPLVLAFLDHLETAPGAVPARVMRGWRRSAPSSASCARKPPLAPPMSDHPRDSPETPRAQDDGLSGGKRNPGGI